MAGDVTVRELQVQIHDWAVRKGWWRPDEQRNFGELVALMHTELSEALEEWRNHHPLAEIYVVEGKPEGVPVELADLVIRVLDTAEHYGIDLGAVMLQKMAYNESRPYRHGGKLA